MTVKIGKVERYINETLESKGAMLFSLIDPIDYKSEDGAVKSAAESVKGGADLVLIGGSIGVQGSILDNVTKRIRDSVDVPVVIFPGNIGTITVNSDALYFMSLLNSRNAYWITQAQMLAAPVIKKSGVEPLPVGYIVVHPGGTVGWIGDVNLIPREKPLLASSLAMAGEFLGNRMIITDTGSNPQLQKFGPVPNEMIRAVKSAISVPYVVAGGIRSIEQIRDVYSNGADIVQVGTVFEASATRKMATAFSNVAKEEGRKKLRV
jgi:phosphoglycerol geranylgeranyltransferase